MNFQASVGIQLVPDSVELSVCGPLKVQILVGYSGLHPEKSTHRWLPEVQVGMVLGTVQPLSVPCSMAMNFDPLVVLGVPPHALWPWTHGHVQSLMPVVCIQAMGAWVLVGGTYIL